MEAIDIHATSRTVTGKNGNELKPFTTANAADMARRRWAKYRQAAARRVTAEAESIDPTATTAAEAWGLAVAKQYTALLDSDKPRGDDLIRIGQAMGAVPSQADAREEAGGTITNNILAIDADAADRILSALANVARLTAGG